MEDTKNPYNPDLLIRLLQGGSDEELNSEAKDLVYAIYARKSREEDDRQTRSIPDQILECKKIADRDGLKVFDPPFHEAMSAKESGDRKEFLKMMKMFSEGKIDGLIAWHPDRLSRNMLEAGMIIDNLDREIIKDLKFVSYNYEASTMGKVMLALAFAMSKQYSDKLSEDVKRGNRNIASQGKRINIAKPGYIRDKNRLLQPDGKNFDLIVEAFKMRLRGEPLKSIGKYLKEQGFTEKDHEEDIPKYPKLNNTKLSRILRDPLYAGILRTGASLVNLGEIYDFKTAISVQDFLEINKFNTIDKVFRQRKSIPGMKSETKLMRKMVVCGYCNKNFTASITHKHSKSGKEDWYYYFRCDTPGCKFKNKSEKAKVIIDFVCGFLRELQYDSPKLYREYKTELARVNKKAGERLKGEKDQLTRAITQSKEQISAFKQYIVNAQDNKLRGLFEDDLNQEIERLETKEARLQEIRKLMEVGSTAPLTHEQFIELMNKLPDEIEKTQDMEQLDYKIRKLFSNFVIKDKKVLMYTLQSPFKEFLETGIISQCRVREIDLELVDSILTYHDRILQFCYDLENPPQVKIPLSEYPVIY